MPQNITKYRIFVASPSDVLDERAAMNDVIQELNLTYGSKNNLIFELVKWETHSAPGINLRGAQNIINKDIGADYDLFIGILWTRFGTPTKVADSGTQEEFDNAYRRYIADPASLQILFYFKSSAPKTLSEINPEQFLKVNEFKKAISAADIYFWEFGSINELQSFLRIHIPKRVESMSSKIIISDISKTLDPTESNSIDAVEELGLVDYQEIRDESLQVSTKAITILVDATEWIGKKINDCATEINSATAKKTELTNKEIRDFCLRVASVMEEYVDIIEPEIPIFINKFEIAGDAMLNIIKLRKDGFENDKDGDLAMVNSLIESITGAKEGMSGFYNSVAILPRMSKELNKARRRVEEKLALLLSKLDFCLSIAEEIRSSLVNS